MTDFQASPPALPNPLVPVDAADDTTLHPVSADLDAALRGMGLAPARAWIPDPQAKQSSATAKRTRKSRNKAAEKGLKQISITMPIELHALARELAARTKAGEPATQVLDALKMTISESEPVPPNTMPATITPEPMSALLGLSAWRRWLINLLLPDESRVLLHPSGKRAPTR